MLWSYVDFTNRRHQQTPFSQLEALSVRQRDQALLQNPWVAGQQLHEGVVPPDGDGCDDQDQSQARGHRGGRPQSRVPMHGRG